VALLVIVLVPGLGHEVNGSRRWLRLGFMNFQVSELARVLLLTYVASYAVRRADELRASFKGFMRPVAVLGGAAVLLLLEPDFGAATVLLATGVAVLFLAGARITHLLVPIVLGVAAMGTLAVTSAYRLRRLTAFRNPWEDPFNSGFQLVQSLIAIGRGEWFGVASVRACRSCSTCRRRTPISCSRCSPRSSASSAWSSCCRCLRCWSAARSRSRVMPRAPGCSSSRTSPRPSASGSACRHS